MKVQTKYSVFNNPGIFAFIITIAISINGWVIWSSWLDSRRLQMVQEQILETNLVKERMDGFIRNAFTSARSLSFLIEYDKLDNDFENVSELLVAGKTIKDG